MADISEFGISGFMINNFSFTSFNKSKDSLISCVYGIKKGVIIIEAVIPVMISIGMNKRTIFLILFGNLVFNKKVVERKIK